MNSFLPINRCARMITLAVAPLIFAGGQGVAAGVTEITWGVSGHFNKSLTVVAGNVAEVCGKLPPGLKVRWEFDADGPLDFNVHYHSGKHVEFPSKLQSVKMAHGVLETRSDQSYCWMWSNSTSKSATLTLHLER